MNETKLNRETRDLLGWVQHSRAKLSGFDTPSDLARAAVLAKHRTSPEVIPDTGQEVSPDM